MSSSSTTVYVGLGSNLDNPEHHVRMALDALARIPNTSLVRHSSLYRSAPMGPRDQPDYINAVAALETSLPARDLMAALQAIERQHGRERGAVKWGPRTLDLDLLLYGHEQIQEAALTVPHPGLAERPFVLYPLSEIAPAIDVPGIGPLEGLRRSCPSAGLERLEPLTEKTSV